MTTLTTDPGAMSTPDGEPTGDDITIIPDPPPAERTATVTARPALTSRQVWTMVGIWLAVVVACFALVIYGIEPLFTARHQSDLLATYRVDIAHASAETSGLPGVSTPTKAIEIGAPVGIIEINALHMQQVAIEGASAAQTEAGPAHVPGTAAPGQPGNSVLIGRRTAYGGPFHDLDQLGPDDAILVTTTQGQVVYKVSSVDEVTIVAPPSSASSAASPPAASAGAEPSDDHTTTLDELYDPTKDDRLTLVTSDSVVPWNSSRATVVVAIMEGLPFAPTPQNGRTDTSTRISGSLSTWASITLALFGFVAAAVAAMWLYRRSTARIAYLLTTAPLIVFAVVLAEQLTKLLPTWT